MTLPVFLTILLLLNILTFFAFCIDKVRAVRGQRRISEVSLLGMSVVGGIGALSASNLIRHKTRKQPFRKYLEIITVGHVFIVCFLATLLI